MREEVICTNCGKKIGENGIIVCCPSTDETLRGMCKECANARLGVPSFTWENQFDLFCKSDYENLGSAGWRVGCNTVKTFIKGLLTKQKKDEDTLISLLEELPTGIHLHKGKGGWSIVYSTLTLWNYNPQLSHLKPPYSKKQFATPLEALMFCKEWLIKNDWKK